MAALILVIPGVDWTGSGGLFKWILEFLIARMSDEGAAGVDADEVDNNLSSASRVAQKRTRCPSAGASCTVLPRG